MKWFKDFEQVPPEGVDLILLDHFTGHGPWIGRYNATQNRFSIAQPSEIAWIGPNASWCVIEFPEEAKT